MLVLAAAAVRYSSKPFKSWASQAADGLQAENFYWREKKTPVSVVKAASLRP